MHPTTDPKPRPSQGKRVLFALVLSVLVLALAEGIGWLALSFLGGGGQPSPSETAERKPDAPMAAEELTAALLDPKREVLHPFLGFVRDPAFKDIPWAGVSEQGFLTDAREAPAAAGEEASRPFTIAVFGGSVANIFSFIGGDRLAMVLRRSPDWRGRHIRIRSFAMGGYKQPQQLFALTYLLALGERFDMVINLDGFNDVVLSAENAKRDVFPFYPRDWGRRVVGLPDAGSQRLAGEIAFREGRRQRRAEMCWGPLAYSSLCRLLRRALVHASERQVAALRAELAAWKEGPRAFLNAGPTFAARGEREMLRELAEYWGRCSLLMHQLCGARGIPYHHFLQPNQYVPDSKPMGRAERRKAFDPKHRYRRAARLGYPQLVEVGEELRRRGVAFHDLTGVFAEVEEPLYIDTCCHFDRRGNILLAEAMGDLITRNAAGDGGTVAAAAAARGADRVNPGSRADQKR